MEERWWKFSFVEIFFYGWVAKLRPRYSWSMIVLCSYESHGGFRSEERIVRAILVALREGQGLAQFEIPPLPRETPPNTPPLPRETPSITPPISREVEFKFNIFSKGICSLRS